MYFNGSRKDKLKIFQKENEKLNSNFRALNKQLLAEVPLIKEGHQCLICGYESYYEFLPEIISDNICPNCQSTQSDRLIYHLLKNESTFFTEKSRIMHTNPSKGLYDLFKNYENLDYYTLDKVFNERTSCVVDFYDLEFEDNFFDYIISIDLLNNQKYDKDILSEFLRVLKRGGWLILKVPINTQLYCSIENPKKEELDIKKYGVHVDDKRVYGNDFKDILHSVGFKILSSNYADVISDEISKYSLSDEVFFLCTKY